MLTELVFPDPAGYADLATLVRRAKRADPDAAVRLQASGGVLRVWVGVLPGTGLLADGAAVGVRGMALADTAGGSTAEGSTAEGSTAGGSMAEEVTSGDSIAGSSSALDLVCSASALLDRFARDGAGATSLTLPTVSTYAAWSGALPAIGGWAPSGEMSAADLIAAATSGIAEIAEGVGPSGTVAGTRAVDELRRRVWARSVPTRTVEATVSGIDRLAEAGPASGAGNVELAGAGEASGAGTVGLAEAGPASGAGTVRLAGAGEARTAGIAVPAGAAFAAYVLGFLPDPKESVRVWRSGRWVRLQTQVGHVVARP